MKTSFDSSSKTDPSRQCPNCGSNKIRRSHTKSTESLFSRIFYDRYRCRDCRTRTLAINPVRVFWFISTTVLFLGAIAFSVAAYWLSQAPTPTVQAQTQEPAEIKQLEQLALNGDTEAELKLGLYYQNGQNNFDNARKAAKWFQNAANHGHTEGAYKYGMALLKGQGVLVNYTEALRWLEKSARLGYSRAQYELGNIYRFKIGVEADIKQAYLWYTLAAAQGLAEAASARDSVAVSLTHQEIVELQEQASKLHQGD